LRDQQLQPWIFLNVKVQTACTQADDIAFHQTFAEALSDLIVEFGLEQRAFVETLNRDFLLATREVNADLRLIFDDEVYERGIGVVLEHDFDGLAISNEQVTAAQVADAHTQGKWLLIWGVRILDATQKAVEKSPELIMTDDIRMLRGVLGK
ncbi:MAG: hypothetical protein AAF570_21500, partial [Bacteroidota bacterium]